MSSTLYRKYRPQRFSEVVGQKHIVQTLTNALKHERLGQAYLFTGPRGTGKTTLARLLAKAANCLNRKKGTAEPCLECPSCLATAQGNSLNVIEIDAASNTGVDNIRELRETVKLPPTQSPHKVYIIDEVHMLSSGAFNALLKTLEEPPKHVIFILATTALHKVPDTILSRCQRFDFSRFQADWIVEKLSAIAKNEKVKVDQAALEMIALAAEGGMRDAESLLAQVIALEDKHITAAETAAILGITEQQTVEQFAGHLADRKLHEALILIQKLVDNGSDLYIFSNSLLHYLRQALLIGIDQKLAKELSLELTSEQIQNLIQTTQKLSTTDILLLLDLFQNARKEIRSATLPQLPVEIATVKFISNIQPHNPSSNERPQQPTKPSTPPASPTKIASRPTSSGTHKQIVLSPTTSTSETSPSETHQTSTNHSVSEKASDTSSSPSFNTVILQWKAVIEEAKALNASLALVLLNFRPVSVENSLITLATSFAFHKDKLNTPENRLTVEKAFDTILKVKTRVNIVVESSSTPSQDARQNTENPLVMQAISILGGQVVG